MGCVRGVGGGINLIMESWYVRGVQQGLMRIRSLAGIAMPVGRASSNLPPVVVGARGVPMGSSRTQRDIQRNVLRVEWGCRTMAKCPLQ